MRIGLQKVKQLQKRGVEPTPSQDKRISVLEAHKAVRDRERLEKKNRRSQIPFSGVFLSQNIAIGHRYLASKGLPHSEKAAAAANPKR